MRFQDEEVAKINEADVDGIFELIVKYLCGERYHKTLSEIEKGLLLDLLSKARTEGVDYAQFNELLLLLDQDRVSKAFFRFFFGEEESH